MKKSLVLIALFVLMATGYLSAQEIKTSVVPRLVKIALINKYPNAKKVKWEKEHGNYEANWGGKSGEDNSVQYTPDGKFIEIVVAITANQLPKPIFRYVKTHYKTSKIKESGRVTDAYGMISYEVGVKGKDLLFDKNGNFIKTE